MNVWIVTMKGYGQKHIIDVYRSEDKANEAIKVIQNDDSSEYSHMYGEVVVKTVIGED